jgi:hypothetical protein
VAVSKFTERLGLTETVIRVFEDNDANKQRATTTTQGIYEDACLLLGDSEGEEKLVALAEFGASFLQVTFGIRASPAVLLDSRDDDSYDPPTVQEGVPPP